MFVKYALNKKKKTFFFRHNKMTFRPVPRIIGNIPISSFYKFHY